LINEKLMITSSRTPGGVPNRCPVCGNEISISISLGPSFPAGDACCPQCGHLLWFVILGRKIRVYKHERVPPKIRQLIESLPSAQSEPDSLDIVEIVMEIEEELGINITDAEQEKIKTLEDLIDFLLGNLPD
jgi:acyl carrier protein